MFKKFIFCLIIFYAVIPNIVKASDSSSAKIGNEYYDSLEDAIAHADSDDIIMLTSNVVLDETLTINKVINLNLNGRSITAPEKVFLVQGGTLNITGKGTIKESEPNYGAIMIKGSTNSTDNEYSVVNIGKDVTLEGWSGIFITHDSSKSYGVTANLAGKINSVNDINGGTGAGIYVNGTIQHQTNYPVINILDGAEINSTGTGLYIAGYSKYNIDDAYITGVESGISIKAGILNIDGATIICTGEDDTPTEGNNNGVNPSGAAIQIESNSGYAGNIELNIKSGTIKSKHSNVIYEYIGKGTTTQVNKLNISGGTFKSEANKEVFSLSNSLKNNHPTFITGGKYSSNPSTYLTSGYTTTIDNNLYTVIKSTMKEVLFNKIDSNNNNFIKPLIITLVITILLVTMYLNRIKLINFLNKIIKS